APVWIESTHEAPEHRAHLLPLAYPRAHPRVPARGRLGAADTGWPRRLPSPGAAGGVARPIAEFLRRRPRAVRDPVEARRTAWARRAGRPPQLQGPDAPRPVAG